MSRRPNSLNLPPMNSDTANLEEPANPEALSHLRTVSELIASFAKGHISYEEYREKLDAWWEQHKAAWQDSDLQRLFLLCCLAD
jgi:hypothetical protein